MRHDRIMDVHHTYADWQAAGIEPPPLVWPTPAAPPAVAGRRGAGRRFGVAVAAVLFTAGVVVGCAHGSTKTVEGRATAEQQVVVTGDELVEMWKNRTLPCNPSSLDTEPPENRSGLIPPGAYPTAGDIEQELRTRTATGGTDFVKERIQHLNVILVLTESDMSAEERDGSAAIKAAGGDAAPEKEAVDHARDMLGMQRSQYTNAVQQTLEQLRKGSTEGDAPDAFTIARLGCS